MYLDHIVPHKRTVYMLSESLQFIFSGESLHPVQCVEESNVFALCGAEGEIHAPIYQQEWPTDLSGKIL